MTVWQRVRGALRPVKRRIKSAFGISHIEHELAQSALSIARIDQALANLQQDQKGLAGQEQLVNDFRLLQQQWREHIPEFLNAVSSVRAFGLGLAATRERVDAAWDRLEFIRRELLYEIAYGGISTKNKSIDQDREA